MKYLLILLSCILFSSCIVSKIKKESISSNQTDVILYSTSWCFWCKKAKEFLLDNNIDYTEKNLESPKSYKELILLQYLLN